MRIVTTKPSVYRSTVTGHWIVDVSGTKTSPSSNMRHRQGWRRWEDARDDAISKVRTIEISNEEGV